MESVWALKLPYPPCVFFGFIPGFGKVWEGDAQVKMLAGKTS